MKNIICPICKKEMVKKDKQYVCPSLHSFDISKEGYVNLILPNKKNSAIPGDNAEMVLARENFLEKGYYNSLRETLICASKKYKDNTISILDAGCGTGYYSIHMKKNRNLNDTLIGVDISKFAVKKAAKKDINSVFIAASIFDLPIASNSIDLILNVFSPKANIEFMRVLKKDGIIFEVMPGENHLIELKELLYKDNTRKKEVEFNYSGFKLKDHINVTYKINIDSNEDIMNLLSMTPYLYKTKLEDIQDLKKINSIDMTIDFIVAVWKKE